MSINHDKFQKRSALGKGFSSLMGLDGYDDILNDLSSTTTTVKDESSATTEVSGATLSKEQPTSVLSDLDIQNSVIKIDLDKIEPNPSQPRRIFDVEQLNSLSKSIQEDGVIQPIIVSRSPTNPDKYMLIAGERRWRASKQAGLGKIPAIIKEASPETTLRLALIENIQRADLSVIEEAEAYKSLIEDFGLTQEQCAQKVGKDRSSVTNLLRLLSLPKEIQDDIIENTLTMGHGKALLSIENKQSMLRARDIVVKKQLSVRQTEQLCKRLKANPKIEEQKTEDTISPDISYVEETLRSYLKTRVKLVGNEKKGKIQISYFSPAELERLISLIGIEV